MNVTCNNCGWVHFQVSRDFAESEVKRFAEYFYALPEKDQQFLYGGEPSHIEEYEKCHYCGDPYIHFRAAVPGDCPNGCTLSPIIDRRE